ncbi:hypothetical protein KVF89_25250 [Nocardioides carbamazepini]|uniref:hypothetical protein n=1 Tax=Nocardioides carbamazepini TaxID=2854259 RepID=UPI0021499D87|nr:hypothetical protein [Nocardioides carbamazepini]MCR1785867.1 hypothetical protein [Nocardioides carbamazepini]
MRALTAGLLLSLAFVIAGVTLSAEPTYADTKCVQTDPATGTCLVTIEAPDPDPAPDPAGDPKDTGSGAACYWDPSKQGVKSPPAGPVPCTAAEGYWSNAYNCYISPLSPQPPANDPSWQGHQPGDGAVYNCFQPQTQLLVSIWAATAPPGSGSGPTPRDVAQIAIGQMDLRAIRIGILPKPGPDSVGVVGMPVWMWARTPDAHTYGPITASASAGGITITATARVRQITWDMGDGTKVVCRKPGTPYQPSYGRKPSPDCGHTYTTSSAHEPQQTYAVTATSDWIVQWSGAGQTGTIRLNGLVRRTQITVGEAQVLVN